MFKEKVLPIIDPLI